MSNYHSVIRNSPAIAREASSHGGSIVNKDDEGGFFRREKKPENAARERAILKYEGRKNSCPVCHTAKSLAGTCDCD
jgi:hypothetical protein